MPAYSSVACMFGNQRCGAAPKKEITWCMGAY